MCMSFEYMFLMMLILSPSNLKRLIDVYLEPLIEEWQNLWHVGVRTRDSAKEFMMPAASMWTVNDLYSNGLASGWSTIGVMWCPVGMEDICAFYLQNDRKACYFNCHRQFFPLDHPYRRNKKAFTKNQAERKVARPKFMGEQIRDWVEEFMSEEGAARAPIFLVREHEDYLLANKDFQQESSKNKANPTTSSTVYRRDPPLSGAKLDQPPKQIEVYECYYKTEDGNWSRPRAAEVAFDRQVWALLLLPTHTIGAFTGCIEVWFRHVCASLDPLFADVSLFFADRLLQEFAETNQSLAPRLTATRTMQQQNWQPPSHGVVKISFDGDVFDSSTEMGWGCRW
ncbi:UNVERIFIED_CONTAM: hypothetical protein Sangu_1879500 [Sesamum angustifolium]|uniref:Uncharacterized protein n=1 Tax=Sesamum angustifolium TaxID=2727405 RepID=A0AAW2LWB8_9LAMI